MTTWQYARLIIQAVPIHNWRALWLGPDDRMVEVDQFDSQSDSSLDPWNLNRWHVHMLNRTGSDGWELVYIQTYEGDYHYVFKRPAL
jgi:hypothetical protein